MMTARNVKAWLETLAPDRNVAMDEGGLQLVELDSRGQPTGAYLEIGGIPAADEIHAASEPFRCPTCGAFNAKPGTCGQCGSLVPAE